MTFTNVNVDPRLLYRIQKTLQTSARARPISEYTPPSGFIPTGHGGIARKGKKRRARPRPLREGVQKPLYVSRPVLNAEQIQAWANSHGLKTIDPSKMHVTQLYSRSPIEHDIVAPNHNMLVLHGGPRTVTKFGDAMVMKLHSPEMQQRHHEFMERGASHDFDEYEPHVTISYDGNDVDPSHIPAYSGPIHLGPEKFEDLDLDWKDKLEPMHEEFKNAYPEVSPIHKELSDFYRNPKHIIMSQDEHGNDGETAIHDYTTDSGTLNYPLYNRHNEVHALTKMHHQDIHDNMADMLAGHVHPRNIARMNMLDRQLKMAKTPRELTLYSGLKGKPSSQHEFYHPTYTSSSLLFDRAYDYAKPQGSKSHTDEGHIMRITYPKGSHGIYAEPYSSHPGEHEFIIPRGVTFKVTGYQQHRHGKMKIHLWDVSPIHGHN